MPEEDNAIEPTVESLSSTSQSGESDMVTFEADVETSVASFPTVSQQSTEPDTSATETTVASFTSVLQPTVPITNAAVEKLLETSPAKVKMIELYYGYIMD